MSRDTLIDVFHDLARARGPFLVYDDGFRAWTYSYQEVGRAARGFAGRLADAGLRKGDAVVFWSENRPEWIVAFWGCLLDGIIVVPIDYRSSPEFVARIGRVVGAKLLLAGEDVPSVPAALGVPVWKLHELEWREGSPPPVAIGPDDVAEIIFTSGATGDPKGVVITHRNVVANIVPVEREVKKYRAWGRPFFPLRFLNLLPLSHMFGAGNGNVHSADAAGHRDLHARLQLDVLRGYVLRVAPAAAAAGPKEHWVLRWWRYRHLRRLFGFKFWSFVVGAAPLEGDLEAFWSSSATSVAMRLSSRMSRPGSFEHTSALDRFRIYPMEVSLPTVHVDPASEPSQPVTLPSDPSETKPYNWSTSLDENSRGSEIETFTIAEESRNRRLSREDSIRDGDDATGRWRCRLRSHTIWRSRKFYLLRKFRLRESIQPVLPHSSVRNRQA